MVRIGGDDNGSTAERREREREWRKRRGLKRRTEIALPRDSC